MITAIYLQDSAVEVVLLCDEREGGQRCPGTRGWVGQAPSVPSSLLSLWFADAISATNPRVIDDSRARKLSNDLKRCTYYETCATYGLNVERVFQDGNCTHLGGLGMAGASQSALCCPWSRKAAPGQLCGQLFLMGTV